jgi:hypothetical protein
MTVTYTQFLLMNWTTTPSLLRPLQAPRNAAVSVYPWIPSCCMTDRSYCPTIVSARCGEFLKIVMSPFRVAFLEKGKSALVGPSRHSWNSRVLLLPSHYILMSPAVVKGDMGIYLIWRLHKLPSCHGDPVTTPCVHFCFLGLRSAFTWCPWSFVSCDLGGRFIPFCFLQKSPGGLACFWIFFDNENINTMKIPIISNFCNNIMSYW